MRPCDDERILSPDAKAKSEGLQADSQDFCIRQRPLKGAARIGPELCSVAIFKKSRLSP